ncbi:DUF4229 domain-containing protein [Catenuloplanes japonicus]|uniref:DUF4229 domain-containing protein n=1 Tax=Catenuloplanes japonicus TaxID=33876 RepID=UPI0006901847|nr:DUF4229 domain-containing protein [Catenuloplanes japonicus]
MAAIKYTAGRIVLFAAFFAALWFVDLDIFLKLIVAVLLSAVASFFLLGRWRDDMAVALADRADKRRAERQRLRAALAGEDEPDRQDQQDEVVTEKAEKADKAG